MEPLINFKYVIASLVYSLVGILILVVTFWIVEKASPDNLWNEILVKQNKALAIIFGAFIIAIAIIIASAVHG